MELLNLTPDGARTRKILLTWLSQDERITSPETSKILADIQDFKHGSIKVPPIQAPLMAIDIPAVALPPLWESKDPCGTGDFGIPRCSSNNFSVFVG